MSVRSTGDPFYCEPTALLAVWGYDSVEQRRAFQIYVVTGRGIGPTACSAASEARGLSFTHSAVYSLSRTLRFAFGYLVDKEHPNHHQRKIHGHIQYQGLRGSC
jgi:hypothetical protein